MEVGDLATGITGTTGGLYALYRIERALVSLYRKRNGNCDNGNSSCPPEVGAAMERSAVIQERTAEVLDRLHDSINSNGAKLDRVIDRLDWMKPK